MASFQQNTNAPLRQMQQEERLVCLLLSDSLAKLLNKELLPHLIKAHSKSSDGTCSSAAGAALRCRARWAGLGSISSSNTMSFFKN